jgi:hypothetical protein
MSVLKLINEFAKREIVPVEVDEVVAYIRALGIVDEIYFWDADFNTRFVKGTLHLWEYPMEGWTNRVADVYTAKSDTVEERRLAQTKELLHILDQRIDRVNTPEDVAGLIGKIVLPANLMDAATDGDHALSDRIAILHAVAVLFPITARDMLLPMFRDKKITVGEIAKLVALPEPYVTFAMSDVWTSTHPAMIAILERSERIPDRVFTLDSNQVTIEIHSVPLETDPYSYAKRLEEKNRDADRPANSFVVETRRGRRTFSSAELAAYVPRNGLKLG